MKLAKMGYGSILEIKQLDSETFIDLVHYENYLSEYQKAVIGLNKKS